MNESKIVQDKPDKTINRRKKNIKLCNILRLSKRNMSYREIGLILGCTKQAIGFRLRKWEKSKIKENKCQVLLLKGQNYTKKYRKR